MMQAVAIPYFDEQIADSITAAQARETRRMYNRMVKVHGGKWDCRGGCGRTISATKELCLACATREGEIDALGLAQQPAD